MEIKAGDQCQTQKCLDHLESYPGSDFCIYHERGDHLLCSGCGGKFINGKIKHTCRECGKEVEPGKLYGLFVPHKCKECQTRREEADIRSNNRCLKCGVIRINCCC